MMTKHFDGAARLRVAGVMLVLVAAVGGGLSGCGILGPKNTVETAATGSPAGAWFSPPAEYPGICMTLAPGGALQFAGGYAFFNPGRWTYDDASSELRIELGGSAPMPPAAQPSRQLVKQGALLRTDEGKRQLVYRVTPETESIDLGGFVFYRRTGCGAQADR
jgi:hypothetical protein